jgi:phosphoserine phosphatase RsbU/P
MSPGESAGIGPEERLRRIEAVTDAGLAHLEVDKLLNVLLDRVHELLAVDTAAVLLLDPSGSHLVATAAFGIDEEVQQGVRIPLGKGFAGRIAARREPVVLEEVSSATVHNPLLLARGIQALLGVPLLVGGTVLGVLHVGTLYPRRFSDEDVQLLQLVADRIALAAQSSLTRSERSAAAALQRSLLPTALPAVDGVELAARYVPGEGEVGGDWYDVFVLPTGGLCIIVGDIMGRGLAAAITMGRMRTTFRALALDCQDPAELLRRVDRNLRHFDAGAMATAVCAVVDPLREELRVSTAGHPPPVLAGPGGAADFIPAAHDLPLGVDADRPRHVTAATVPAGTSVFFYTDGLVERRRESLDVGMDRLLRVMTPGEGVEPGDGMVPGDPERICAAVMAEMVGRNPSADDIAILALVREGAARGAAQPAAAPGVARAMERAS